TCMKKFVIMPYRFPEYRLPPPLDNGWIASLKHLSYDHFKDFLITSDLTHIRYNGIQLPPAWVSDDPALTLTMDFSASSRWLKAIHSGSMFA
ncbi:MAG: hypothetical protein ACPG7F_05980, partial [Aggregatilineales bacterium]